MRPPPFNPVRFGTEVIDQFGRYLMTTFPLADAGLEAQVRERVLQGLVGDRLIARGPYVFLNRPFESGPALEDLISEEGLGLHPRLADLFRFESLHKHQELALRAVLDGRHTVVATGTGSGKTEAFLLPIVDHALKMRDQGVEAGLTALVVYPMNALADDQLRRLRPLLAGTGITFGRYTGVTPESGEPPPRMEHSRPYTPEEQERLEKGDEEAVPLPFEECWSRREIRERRPRILLTNYSQLEYLLLRDRDLDLFRGAPLRFLVLDEVHTYTGALGSEVACLVRRLREVAGRTQDEVVCIGTSATVQEGEESGDAGEVTRNFARRLFGVPGERVELVTETYRDLPVPGPEHYLPEMPEDPQGLLADLLEAARDLHLRDEVEDLTPEVVASAERLCGRTAPGEGPLMDRVHGLLARNRLILTLHDLFRRPERIESAFPRLRALGRDRAPGEDLVAEILAYLTLGALVHEDGEPLLRPRLHYFVQGYRGLALSYDEAGRPQVEFEPEAGHAPDGALIFPLVLCRSCGQHYLSLVCEEEPAPDGPGGAFSLARLPGPFEETEGEEQRVYLAERLVGLDEETADAVEKRWLCRFCATLHREREEACRNGRCGRGGGLVEVHAWFGPLKRCLACGTFTRVYDEVVTPAASSETADVHILAQSMLSAMPEESLRKILVFSDNRQDAAFQAGWMEHRGIRFRLRHILYDILHREPGRIWDLDELEQEILDESQRRGIYQPATWSDRKNRVRIRWFLIEEFMSTAQRRYSLESIPMAEALVGGIGPGDRPGFYKEWTRRLGVGSEDLEGLLRLLAGYYRIRGAVSDPLLARQWSYQDWEVRERLVNTHDHYRPLALVLEKTEKSSFTRGWIAGNGRSGAQVLLKQCLAGGEELSAETRDLFLSDLWAWWKEAGVLQPVTLTRKRAGAQQPIGSGGQVFQIDGAHLGFRASDRHLVCSACRRSQAADSPSGRCPEYGCGGRLREQSRPEDHYDVVQYTRGAFVPMLSREHSAQVPKGERQEAEREFKKRKGGRFNCLVCTPTLELGVDIGRLEMALMRNVPPTPANYAQRAGRAGRRHRIGVIVAHCGGGAHDRYFFLDPPAMIAGEIRVPAFSMRNEPLIRKQVHSAVLTMLQDAASDEERETLDHVFPPFIWEYFADRTQGEDKERVRYLSSPRDLSALERLVSRRRGDLLAGLRRIFQESWPAEDLEAVADEALAGMLDEMAAGLARHVRRLFGRVSAYRGELDRLRGIENAGEQLTEEEEAARRRFQHALRTLASASRLDNYTLAWLCRDGFLPGYALARESITARCLDPYIEIGRSSTVALRELTPSNFVYANRNVFRIRKLAMYTVHGEDPAHRAMVLQRNMVYFKGQDRIEEAGAGRREGGEEKPREFTSFQLTDVEMFRAQNIDDRESRRRRVGFKVLGLTLPEHGGGMRGRVGGQEVVLLERHRIRLQNLGERKRGGPLPFTLFPLCRICGETRSARASEAEIEEFIEDHRKLHHEESVDRYGLHVDLVSDTLQIGPFQEAAEANNLFEAIRVGARLVLEMGTTEVEGFDGVDEEGGHWAVLYDPMPGGTGFLPQIAQFWPAVCRCAVQALEHCPGGCETACYSCLKHFRNQHVHDELNRFKAIEILRGLAVPLELGHRVPPVTLQPRPDPAPADSDAEFDFGEICRRRGVPVPPVAQFRLDLGNGDSTVADWAYPEQKVLVFIDGMSRALHGDPQQRQRDRIRRAKARMLGWQVVEITAAALKDEGSLAVHLEELALYLEGKE